MQGKPGPLMWLNGPCQGLVALCSCQVSPHFEHERHNSVTLYICIKGLYLRG